MDKEVLLEEDILKVLQERFHNKNIKLINSKLSSFSQDVEGYMGDHFLLETTCEFENSTHNETFFVKVKTPNNETLRLTNYYKKEIYLYNFLFKKFEKLGLDINFAPKCYHCTTDETIILENLKQKEYKPVEKYFFFDYEHCKEVIRSIAHFHANSIIYEEIKSKELKKEFRLNNGNSIFNEEFYISDPKASGSKFMKYTVDSLIAASKLLNKDEAWKADFERKLKGFQITAIFNTYFPFRKTLCHGDLWFNNILFKYSKEKPIHARIVDYQMLRYGDPIFDVLLIIYTNTRREFRDKYYDSLINYYFTEFQEILYNHGLNAESLLSKEECSKVVESLKSLALLQSAGDRSLAMLPVENVNNSASGDGDELQDILFTEERTKVVIEALKDKRYKKIITEDIEELYNFLS